VLAQGVFTDESIVGWLGETFPDVLVERLKNLPVDEDLTRIN